MTRKILILSVALSGVLGLSAVWAQDKLSTSSESPIYVGGPAEAGGNMLLRDSAPQNTALWYSKGKEIGVLSEGEVVEIQDIKKLPSLIGNQTWVKVKRLDPDASPATGWVYYGGAEYLMAPTEKPLDLKKFDDGTGDTK